MTQGVFATEERRGLHEEGWSDSFGRLEQVLGEVRESGTPPTRTWVVAPMSRRRLQFRATKLDRPQPLDDQGFYPAGDEHEFD